MSQKYTIPTLSTRPPLLDPRAIRICVFGGSGSGKTTFGASFPSHIYFDLDDGTEACSVRLFPLQVPSDFQQWARKQTPPQASSRWTWLKFGIHEAITSGKGEAIIIDTIDACCDWALEHVCQSHKISHPSDKPRESAQIWGKINREIESLIKATRLHTGAVVFISHETQRDYDTDGNVIGLFDKHQGSIVTRYVPSLREKPREALEKVCSLIGRAHIDGNGHRWLYIGNNPKYSTKKRIPPQVAHTFPDNIQLSYEALLDCYRQAHREINASSKNPPSKSDS